MVVVFVVVVEASLWGHNATLGAHNVSLGQHDFHYPSGRGVVIWLAADVLVLKPMEGKKG